MMLRVKCTEILKEVLVPPFFWSKAKDSLNSSGIKGCGERTVYVWPGPG